MFIVIDGHDGSGKTTAAKDLKLYYNHKEEAITMQEYPVRKKGDLMDFFLSAPDGNGIHPLTFQTLCVHQRIVASPDIERIYVGNPTNHFIAVRWVSSGVVYGTLDLTHKLNYEFNIAYRLMNDMNCNLVKPDYGFIIVCNPELAVQRISKRGEKITTYEDVLTIQRAKALYEKFYLDNIQDYSIIDTTFVSPEETLKLMIKSLLS